MKNTSSKLILINPFCPEFSKRERLDKLIEYSTRGYDYYELTTAEEVVSADLCNRRILFAVSLGESGINMNWMAIMKYFRLHTEALEGSIAGVIVNGMSEIFTKSTARELVFTANRAGCSFVGKPLVEGTKTLKNYNIQAKNLELDNYHVYLESGRLLIERIMTYEKPRLESPRILMVHASDKKTSNCLALWDMIASHLDGFRINTVSLRNGTVMDCRGCSYETCRHMGEEGKCYYGGRVEEVYSAVLDCNAIVFVCPNYNDAMGANLTAFVNRLTALYTANRFYDKQVFAAIVSGYSGGDIVAQQIISGLNMNKSFALPGKFAIMETANDPREIIESEGVLERAARFANNIRKQLT